MGDGGPAWEQQEINRPTQQINPPKAGMPPLRGPYVPPQNPQYQQQV